MSVFFTKVDGGVAKALNARKAYYASELRGDGAHAWLHQKIAYATATAKGPTSTASLKTPTSGGLGRARGSGTKGGMYQAINPDNNSYQFVPKPHINSVSISAEGDYGSILKAEVKFTVYTLGQLDAYMAFFELGGDLGISYGWNDAGGAGGKPGKFQGKIYNFNYSVTSTGGFDCTSYAMQGGFSILGAESDITTDSQKTITDALGNEMPTNNLYGLLVGLWAEQVVSDPTGDQTEPNDGIMVLRMAKGFAEPPDSRGREEDPPVPPEINWDDKIGIGFVSLDKLVRLYNQAFRKLSNTSPAKVLKQVHIQCNATVSKTYVPSDATQMVSANPLEIQFPGYSTYGENNDFSFGSYDAAFKGGDASKIMIGVQLLQKIYGEETGRGRDRGAKSKDTSISRIFQAIFDAIYKHSGNRIQLSLVTKPTDKTGNTLLVVDPTYYDSKNGAYVISAVTQGGICRNISMSSKLPSEMATVAFIGAQTSAGVTAADLSIMQGGQKKKEAPDPVTLEAAKKALDTQGPKDEHVKNLQSALNNVRAGATDLKGAIPVPIDLTVTLDGIEGFVFGNVITTNYLPGIYKKAGVNIGFTVTKVQQSISGGDWTTTLNTVCRIVNG